MIAEWVDAAMFPFGFQLFGCSQGSVDTAGYV
jgi:hypothetical protein